MTSLPPQPQHDEPVLQPNYAAPYSQLPASKPGTNGFAITALVFGIIPMCSGLLGLVFGIIALFQIRKTGQKGKGLAIAGVTLSSLWIVGIVVAVTIGILAEAKRDDSGDITEAGDVGVNSLQVGDCIEKIEEGVAVYDLPAVPCSKPHTAEVVGKYQIADGSYPGEDAIDREATERCDELLISYAGEVAAADIEEFFYMYPRASDWLRGDREVVCMAYHDPPATGSLRH